MTMSGNRTGVALLGATGSIGKSALRVLERQREQFSAVALTANGNRQALAELEAAWSPAYVGLVQETGEAPAHWGRGPASLVAAATHPDVQVVINAVVGAAGLDATLAALKAGKRVALANKETLVMAGDLVQRVAPEFGGLRGPADGENSAIF